MKPGKFTNEIQLCRNYPHQMLATSTLDRIRKQKLRMRVRPEEWKLTRLAAWPPWRVLHRTNLPWETRLSNHRRDPPASKHTTWPLQCTTNITAWRMNIQLDKYIQGSHLKMKFTDFSKTFKDSDINSQRFSLMLSLLSKACISPCGHPLAD